MRSLSILIAILTWSQLSAQQTHALIMNGEDFIPDTIYMMPGDSVQVSFDTTGHSMVQVLEASWNDEVAAPLIGISLGEGTPNPGDNHIFDMDSLGTFYYVCQQHPDEKGLIIVGDFTGMREYRMPGFTVYPQPASDQLYIDNNDSYASVRVDDHQGRPVATSPRIGQSGLDVTAMPPGIYFITLLDEKGVTLAREKIIISR